MWHFQLTKIAKSTTNYDDITDEEEDENVFNCSLSDEDDDDSQSISSNEELRSTLTKSINSFTLCIFILNPGKATTKIPNLEEISELKVRIQMAK